MGLCLNISIQRSYGSIASADDCQNLCQLRYNCDFFVYGSSTLTCWLRRAASTVYTATATITGPKYCNGNKPF